MLLDILKESLRLMKKNLNLAQLILLFFVIMTIFMPVMASIKFNWRILPMLVAFYVLICTFFSGIFFALKKALEYDTNPPKSEDGLPPFYFAEFFQGIGNYLKKFLLAGMIVLIILFSVAFLYRYIVHTYIGIPQKFIDAVTSKVLTSDAKILEFFTSLTPDEQTKLSKIGVLVLLSICSFGYLTMLYPVVLVNEEKNFFVSFFSSLKYLVKNIPVSLIIFLFFNFILSFMNMVGAAFVNNIIISFIVIILQCYLNVWYLLSLFVYYEKTK